MTTLRRNSVLCLRTPFPLSPYPSGPAAMTEVAAGALWPHGPEVCCGDVAGYGRARPRHPAPSSRGAGWRKDHLDVEATLRARVGGECGAVRVGDGAHDGEAESMPFA